MRILLADDDPVTRRLLQQAVAAWGYDSMTAATGAEALAACAGADAPRLVVLDWVMPEMDGIEVCRTLRARPEAPPTYIILLTARSDKADLVYALEQGADDYLAKPFDRDELRSRLRVGQRQIEMQDQLERYATQMEALAAERSRQLLHAERMATIGLMAAGIAHEINNPTAFIAGNVQTQRKFWERIDGVLARHPDLGAEDPALSMIVEEMPGTIDGIAKGADRIAHIAKGLKGFCRQEDGQHHPCNLNHCVDESLALTHNALKHHVSVELDLGSDLPEILADRQQIEQVLVNLLINAADAIAERQTRSPAAARDNAQGRIRIGSGHNPEGVYLTVEDDGPGIPPDKLDAIWEPFYTTKPADRGTGLGLAIIRGIIENHGGTIAARNKDTGGAHFTIRLPLPI